MRSAALSSTTYAKSGPAASRPVCRNSFDTWKRGGRPTRRNDVPGAALPDATYTGWLIEPKSWAAPPTCGHRECASYVLTETGELYPLVQPNNSRPSLYELPKRNGRTLQRRCLPRIGASKQAICQQLDALDDLA